MTLEPCKQALEDAGLKPVDIDEIILVGGSTRIPRAQQLVKDFFGKEPNKSVNPDEVVAVGAAIQGAVLGGEMKDILLLDVTPLSLGVETLGGVVTRIIPRNTTIPVRKGETFTTAADGQTSVEIHVLQGEREMAKDNRSLGKFILSGIPPAPRGIPKIEVSYDIDANGILHVSAKDMATGKQQSITITGSSGLSKEEIDKMVKESESHKEEDRKRRELVELRNKVDGLAYELEKLMKENKDKLSPANVEEAEKVISRSKEALDSQNENELRKAFDELNSVSSKIAQELYSKAQASQKKTQPEEEKKASETSQQKNSSESSEDVIDAEYEEGN